MIREKTSEIERVFFCEEIFGSASIFASIQIAKKKGLGRGRAAQSVRGHGPRRIQKSDILQQNL